MQCTSELFWREINRRDFVPSHYFEEIPKVDMEQLSSFPLGNGMPAQ
jgi:hypothetical protein